MFTHHGANPLLEETAAKLMSRSSIDANNDVVLISSDGNNNAKIKELRGLNPHAFLVVFQEPTGIRRMEYFRSGANMVSFSLDDCSTAMEKVKQHLELSKQTSELFSCPSCAKPNLSLTALWYLCVRCDLLIHSYDGNFPFRLISYPLMFQGAPADVPRVRGQH